MKLAPSILAADLACLGDEVDRVAGSSHWIHVDVMDGHFVPNLTMGPATVGSLARRTDIPLDCHLMIDNPQEFFEPFASAGAKAISFHVEVAENPVSLAAELRGLGVQAGVAINPPTPFSAVEGLLGSIDYLLVMSVNPGFAGQAFIPDVLDKIRAARRLIDDQDLPTLIEVDGGINEETAVLAAAAGANILVAGNAVFAAADPGAAATAIVEAAELARQRALR